MGGARVALIRHGVRILQKKSANKILQSKGLEIREHDKRHRRSKNKVHMQIGNDGRSCL